MDPTLLSLSIKVFEFEFSLCLCLSLSLSVCLSPSLSVSVLCLSISVSASLSVCLCLSVVLSLSVSVSLSSPPPPSLPALSLPLSLLIVCLSVPPLLSFRFFSLLYLYHSLPSRCPLFPGSDLVVFVELMGTEPVSTCSGCLTSFLFLRSTKKTGLSLSTMVLYYVHRIWRYNY